MARPQIFKMIFIIICVATTSLAFNKAADNSETTLSTTKRPSIASIARTEIKVSRSLNPANTQTLEVVTRDGNVAKLIVKKRDPKAQQQPLIQQNSQQTLDNFNTNWIPIATSSSSASSSVETVRNANQQQQQHNRTVHHTQTTSNVIDSDIIPYVPRPVTITSGDIYVKPNVDKESNNNNIKRGRAVHLPPPSSSSHSITSEQTASSIPVIHGVRVPDDESDKTKTWRNARVINGELFPYEEGYKPPAAIPIGELIYATHPINDDADDGKSDDVNGSIGPFTKEDNYKREPMLNHRVQFSHFGPFTKEDNIKYANAKLIDYIKEINDKEAKRDYFAGTGRKYSQIGGIQRRMLQYPSYSNYPASSLYTPTTHSKLNFNEGVRAPVLQYAHPELGVQPAKSTPLDDDFVANYELKPNRNFDVPNSVDYYKKDVLNYPYGSYYVKPKPELPLWMKITESIRDNVQNGFQRMQQFTRPVFEPLVEASHKISYNLGLGGGYPHHHQQQQQHVAQKKVGVLAPVGASSVILPALGLVAGGAALGLGAAAVGRFLEPEEMRALQHANYLLLTPEKKRLVRSVSNTLLDDNAADDILRITGAGSQALWTDTACSKRVFCEVMTRQSDEHVTFMEKRIDVLLSSMLPALRTNPTVMRSVGQHLDDVWAAVKGKDCARFACRKRILM